MYTVLHRQGQPLIPAVIIMDIKCTDVQMTCMPNAFHLGLSDDDSSCNIFFNSML